MVPRITTGGRSFKGAFLYYLHDKGKSTSERIAWTHTENLLTDDPHKAWKVMAYTAKESSSLKEASGQKATGRKLAKPVFAYSLSWHPDQQPEKEHMLAAARSSLEILKFTEHETVIIAHNDEPQKHVHIIVNRVHPLTGLAADTSHSKLKLSAFAHDYEREHGKIYCKQRETNRRKREKGERAMYRDQNIENAWKQSDDGERFVAALKEKGYQIAQGRNRIVVVDPYGQIHNPTRHLENVRASDFEKRLQGVNLAELRDAAELSHQVQTENKRRYELSLAHDERTARQQNEMQDRQREERVQVSHQYEDRLCQERNQLTRHYRLMEQETQMDALRVKTQNPPWWKRIFGIARRERTRLAEMEQSYQSAQQRLEERLGKIQVEREQSLDRMKQAQQKEQRELATQHSLQPSGYVDANEREKILKHLREKREQTRSRNGPSLER